MRVKQQGTFSLISTKPQWYPVEPSLHCRFHSSFRTRRLCHRILHRHRRIAYPSWLEVRTIHPLPPSASSMELAVPIQLRSRSSGHPATDSELYTRTPSLVSL